jgi:enoyl-CoA hydratase/carnithine racemase
MSQDNVLLAEHEADVLGLTLNRPAAANALSSALHDALVAALAEAACNDRVRAVVLGATGERVFSAGADLKEFAEIDTGEAMLRRRELLLRSLLALLDFPKPLVCAVQAKAIGAGFMLALAADEVLATESASFGFPEIAFGLPSPMGAAMIAARSSRLAVQRLIQGGQTIDAAEALALGLIDGVTERNTLGKQARTRASTALAGRAYAGNKQWINRDLRRQIIEAALAATRLQYGANPIGGDTHAIGNQSRTC